MIQTIVDRYRELLDALTGFRGRIVDAHMGYPEVLHLEVRDHEGALWRFSTQDATWSPSDPAAFRDLSVMRSFLDTRSKELRCELSDGTVFAVVPEPQEAHDDPPNWELFMPDGRLLEYGPGDRWRLVDASGLDD